MSVTYDGVEMAELRITTQTSYRRDGHISVAMYDSRKALWLVFLDVDNIGAIEPTESREVAEKAAQKVLAEAVKADEAHAWARAGEHFPGLHAHKSRAAFVLGYNERRMGK